MSKFSSLSPGSLLSSRPVFSTTYWLSLLRDSMCGEKPTFPRLPNSVALPVLCVNEWLQEKPKMHQVLSLLPCKCHDFYHLCIPVYSSVLPGFLHYILISSPNLRSYSTSIHPEVRICSCNSWVLTALGVKIKLLSKPQKWYSSSDRPLWLQYQHGHLLTATPNSSHLKLRENPYLSLLLFSYMQPLCMEHVSRDL